MDINDIKFYTFIYQNKSAIARTRITSDLNFDLNFDFRLINH